MPDTDAIVAWLEEVIQGLGSLGGGVGLFVIALFDSSLLSLPEINDVLLVYFGAQLGNEAYFLSLMTVLGSATGCSLLYSLARWKGHAYLKARDPHGKFKRVFSLVERYGALAVIAPAILPPPFPFKIFVVSSGVLGLSYSRFLAAVLFGRSVRYFGETYLAIRYGGQALDFLRENAGTAFLIVLVLVVMAASIVLVVGHMRRRNAGARSGSPASFETGSGSSPSSGTSSDSNSKGTALGAGH
jgi:membrane protein YqaA with SNARE-associated domain